MKRLVIFDWDGTLCDSLSRIIRCMQLAAADVGVAIPAEAAVKDIVGLGLREALAALYPEAPDTLIQSLRAAYSNYFVELEMETPSPLYDGAIEVLERLKGDGYLLAIATGKSRRGLDRVLLSTGFGDFFHSSRCADETCSKPNPLMLTELLNEFALDAAQAIFIGDTEFDMAMARQIDMTRIGVGYGAHSLERLKKYQVHYSAEHLFEVEEAVRHWADARP